MKSEKAISAKDGSNTNLKSKITVVNNTPNQNRFQFNSRRELLEQSKLSRLPERNSFLLPTSDNKPSKNIVAGACVGCGVNLDLDDSIQKRFSSCRKCIGIYGRVGAAVEVTEKCERQEILEKFAAEVQR